MKLILSGMTTADLNEVFNLWKITEGVGLLEGETQSNVEKFLNNQAHGSFIVRTEGGELLGAVCSGAVGAVGIIRHLAVRSDVRRQKIGSMLVQAAQEYLRSVGACRTAAFVVSDNSQAAPFWNALGWNVSPNYQCYEKSMYPELRAERNRERK